VSEPNRYRTRPVEVTAVRWLGEDNCKDVFAFLGIEHTGDEHHTICVNSGGKSQLAEVGDWIIHDDGFYEVFTDTAFRAEFEAVGDA
jgi:hypothetical protein